jgi:predicted XRE-type DNA-binding protein
VFKQGDYFSFYDKQLELTFRPTHVKLLEVAQPRISDLKCGKIQLFSIDLLVNMLAKLGKPVSLIIDDRLAA